MLLTPVRFSPDVRRELEAVLNQQGTEDVIRQLEEVVEFIPALTAPEVKTTIAALDTLARAVREVLRAFDRIDDLATNALAGELTLRAGWAKRRGTGDASQVTRSLRDLRDGLGEIDDALAAIAARLARRRGGRRGDIAARWLVWETARILKAAGAPVKQYEDGTLAKVLRILWPVALRREEPTELRPWLKSLKSRR